MVIIVPKRLPHRIMLCLEPPKTLKNGKVLIVPGIGSLDKSELKELVAALSEKHGTKYDEATVEKQVSERMNGTYKRFPSLKRYWKTGSFL